MSKETALELFDAILWWRTGKSSAAAMEVLWKTGASGSWDDYVPAFKMPTMQPRSLHHEDIMRDGYRPRMLLYALDELFYVHDKVRHHRGCDGKIVVSYKILSLMVARCIERRHGTENRGMLDALSLINVNDGQHLECLDGPSMTAHSSLAAGLC